MLLVCPPGLGQGRKAIRESAGSIYRRVSQQKNALTDYNRGAE
jgi:hypothetical protein